MPVRIVTDSASDLSEAEAAELGIEVVPLSIRFGDEEYTDRQDLSVSEFYEKMDALDVLPETAAPSPGAFEQAFRKLAGEGADAVVCINLSLALSATGQAAQAAAKAVADDLRVECVDSKSITAGLGTMVLAAARAARDGADADSIVALVNEMQPRTRVFGVLDTLDNLKKGGRIGNAQAMPMRPPFLRLSSASATPRRCSARCCRSSHASISPRAKSRRPGANARERRPPPGCALSCRTPARSPSSP